MVPSRVQVVCLAVGDAPETYVARLESMLRRHMPVPFDLACVTERPRPLSESVRLLDASGWPPPRPGMRKTTYKLSLYDRNRMPFDEFLYFDTTLAIHRDLAELVEFAFGRDEELVVVKDWHYDAYNTCVMRIRPGGVLTGIPRAYEAGEIYPQRNPGDQDFATAVLRDRGWEGEVATFPEGMVASYKEARRLAKHDRPAAYAALEAATIVKFHGEPKMEQLLDPWYRAGQALRKGRPWHPNAWFWARELRERWR